MNQPMFLPVNRTRKFVITFAVIALLMWVAGHLLSPESLRRLYDREEAMARLAREAQEANAGRLQPPRPAPAPEAGAVAYKDLGWKNSLYTEGENPFTGVTTEAGKSGRLVKRYEMKDGRLHGLMEEWYENGRQKARTHFLEGKHHGENVYWNENGSLQVRKFWDRDTFLREEKS